MKTMKTAPRHLTTSELEGCLEDVLRSPRDEGRLEAIVVRPTTNERLTLTTAQLTPEGGIDGDRWANETSPDPQSQVSLMNARYLRQIAGHEDAICLAGDNLVVDIDLSEENLLAGSRLAIGRSVVLEISGAPHTGCGKFQSRYGAEVRIFTNNERGRQLHLRGRYGKVITGGTIAVGDAVRKIAGTTDRP